MKWFSDFPLELYDVQDVRESRAIAGSMIKAIEVGIKMVERRAVKWLNSANGERQTGYI